jgi:Fe-S oxidoreductase
MALKDFAAEMDRCSSCSYCKWIPFDHVKSWRYAKNCPSVSYYNFNSFSARGRYASARSLINGQSDITDTVEKIAYTCLTCGSCDVSCKICRYNLEPLNMVREFKFELAEKGSFPEEHKKLLKNLSETNNLFGKPRSKRGNWALGLAVKDLTKEKAEVLFHVGCSYSYDKELQGTVRTAAEILKKAGVDFGILGNSEMCCGSRMYSMGQKEAFKKLAKSNIKLWEKAGVKTVITACSDGYYAFKRLYPLLGSTVKVMHIVEYLDLLIKEGKLRFSKAVPLKVTYHDPCHLGRQGEPYEPWEGEEKKIKNQIIVYSPRKPRYNGTKGIYDQPRNILQSIPGIELREMERIREYSWCCGAGGGAREAYPEFSKWTARERLEEAASTGAEALVTACPWCVKNFKDGLDDACKMKVLDILDVVQMAL